MCRSGGVTPGFNRSYDMAVMLTPSLSLWLKLHESSFELVKFMSSSELKTKASNLQTLFNIPTSESGCGCRMDEVRPLVRVSALCLLQCFNTDGWVSLIPRRSLPEQVEDGDTRGTC